MLTLETQEQPSLSVDKCRKHCVGIKLITLDESCPLVELIGIKMFGVFRKLSNSGWNPNLLNLVDWKIQKFMEIDLTLLEHGQN